MVFGCSLPSTTAHTTLSMQLSFPNVVYLRVYPTSPPPRCSLLSSVLCPHGSAGGELQHRSIVDGPLVEALRFGGPSGPVGSECHASVTCEHLDTAIGHASVVGVVTDAAQVLVASAQSIRNLRQAFKVRCQDAWTSAHGTDAHGPTHDANYMQPIARLLIVRVLWCVALAVVCGTGCLVWHWLSCVALAVLCGTGCRTARRTRTTTLWCSC
jgi:hypothetical protein